MNRRNRRTRGTALQIPLVCTVVLLAIGCGYLCSRFLVVPLLQQDPISESEQMAQEPGQAAQTPDQTSDGNGSEGKDEADPAPSGETENQDPGQNPEPSDEPAAEPKTGTRYVIQYGAFSTREGAEERKNELQGLGIQTILLERDNAFKLYGDPCFSESAARLFLEQRKAAAGEDIFITVVEANLL